MLFSSPWHFALRQTCSNEIKKTYDVMRIAEAVAWRNIWRRKERNENNKKVQLANIKTPRYPVRIGMNLDYSVWEKSWETCVRKTQMAQLEWLSVITGGQAEYKKIFYRMKMNLHHQVKDGCIKTWYNCIAGIDCIERNSCILVWQGKQRCQLTNSNNNCDGSL